jgi:hypothetical protein
LPARARQTACHGERNGEGRLIAPASTAPLVAYFFGWNSAFAMIAPLMLKERIRIV